jgi:hypothetical protein
MIGEGDCGEIGGMKIGRGNKSTRRKPAQCHFIHHKSYITRPGFETGAPRWEASDGVALAQRLLHIQSSLALKTLHSAHKVFLCASYGSRNKPKLFPETCLVHVYTVFYAVFMFAGYVCCGGLSRCNSHWVCCIAVLCVVIRVSVLAPATHI